MEGRFKREGTYVYLWLIQVDFVWQKSTWYCKAIILQLKINKYILEKDPGRKKKKKNPVKSESPSPLCLPLGIFHPLSPTLTLLLGSKPPLARAIFGSEPGSKLKSFVSYCNSPGNKICFYCFKHCPALVLFWQPFSIPIEFPHCKIHLQPPPDLIHSSPCETALRPWGWWAVDLALLDHRLFC